MQKCRLYIHFGAWRILGAGEILLLAHAVFEYFVGAIAVLAAIGIIASVFVCLCLKTMTSRLKVKQEIEVDSAGNEKKPKRRLLAKAWKEVHCVVHKNDIRCYKTKGPFFILYSCLHFYSATPLRVRLCNDKLSVRRCLRPSARWEPWAHKLEYFENTFMAGHKLRDFAICWLQHRRTLRKFSRKWMEWGVEKWLTADKTRNISDLLLKIRYRLIIRQSILFSHRPRYA